MADDDTAGSDDAGDAWAILASLRDEIPAPLRRPAIVRLAFLTSLQGALHSTRTVGLAELVEMLAMSLRDHGAAAATGTGFGAWETTLCIASTCVRWSVVEMERRNGVASARLAARTTARRWVVEWLNRPLREHLAGVDEVLVSARLQAARNAGSDAARHAQLARRVLDAAVLFDDLCRWWIGFTRPDQRAPFTSVGSPDGARVAAGRLVHALEDVVALLRSEDAHAGDR